MTVLALNDARSRSDLVQPVGQHEGCDRCVGRAFVSVKMDEYGGNLVFCGHHYARNETVLIRTAFAIRDERLAIGWR